METLAKNTLIEQYRKHGTDTGSPQVQIALLSERINHLTDHLKSHRKDFSTRRGLLMLVGQRRRLLNYLKDRDIEGYRELIGRLGLTSSSAVRPSANPLRPRGVRCEAVFETR
jgi:small subunit ribosomal protein S15